MAFISKIPFKRRRFSDYLYLIDILNDFKIKGLTQKYLENLFGVGIMTPIENVDCVFSLQVN